MILYTYFCLEQSECPITKTIHIATSSTFLEIWYTASLVKMCVYLVEVLLSMMIAINSI